MKQAEPVPVIEDHVRRLAELAGLRVAPEHMQGVIRNLEVLLWQAALLGLEPIDPPVEPATVFRP
jgi:Asp-tRNA(Asn)/Glu-tRNA(Gln) amidotransferase C subunit